MTVLGPICPVSFVAFITQSEESFHPPFVPLLPRSSRRAVLRSPLTRHFCLISYVC